MSRTPLGPSRTRCGRLWTTWRRCTSARSAARCGYNAFTDPANGVSAGGQHEIDVTPYYQDGATTATITSVRLWISTDGGTTWQEVHVAAHDGGYIGHYRSQATTGSVSIKAQATDSAGTTVNQTVLNGYSITG